MNRKKYLVSVKETCAAWWADKLKIEEKREEFYVALLDRLDCGMELDVDYDPCDLLQEVLESIDIPCQGYMFSAMDLLPFKTSMHFKDGKVLVREGYQDDHGEFDWGDWAVLWEVEDEH